jgi:hypothetical protein
MQHRKLYPVAEGQKADQKKRLPPPKRGSRVHEVAERFNAFSVEFIFVLHPA